MILLFLCFFLIKALYNVKAKLTKPVSRKTATLSVAARLMELRYHIIMLQLNINSASYRAFTYPTNWLRLRVRLVCNHRCKPEPPNAFLCFGLPREAIWSELCGS